ncbi:hypothetical protein [uncultured Roseovarius sp.]|uniref:hypothetical protein n=1 Tax=uncultured Roseovarius sp. TaxID=293344 RepID=UPI00260CDCDA|nr:hypothetical protein [uncultured Roseovarius sp.]
MKDHIYDLETEGDPSMSAGHILALARVGVAASDSVMSVDLQRNGYQNLFEVIGDIAGRLMDEISELEHQNEILTMATQASQGKEVR